MSHTLSSRLRLPLLGGTLAVATLLGACTTPVYQQQPVSSYPAPGGTRAPAYVEFGRVTNIEVMQTTTGSRPSGAGALIGGVIGAVVGNQIGSGSGRAVATGAGALGGAVAGHKIEGNRAQVQETYRVSVQTDNGNFRAYDVPSAGDLRVGDRVRIQDGQLQRV